MISTFEEAGLKPEIMSALADLGFETPTEVQQNTIPYILEEESDLVALAQTGTGKTAAFGLPMIQKVDADLRLPQVIVLAPTRELCLQITQDLKSFAKYCQDIHVLAVYGGAGIDHQIRSLRQNPQIIVGTPGRTLDLIRRRKLNLTEIRYVVLDEADEMLNMGFQEDMNAILGETPEERQTLLFSATMAPEVEAIAKNYMKDPRTVSVGTKNSGSDMVEHVYYLVKGRDRYAALRRIADANPGIYGIIFCRTRRETQDIADSLIRDNYNAEALHGDLSQSQRDAVMSRFRNRRLQLLVATDVAARGIDVDDLTHVINYKLPDQAENYIHRSGRTGRAGKEGLSLTLVQPREERHIRSLERMVGKPFELKRVPSGSQVVARQVDNYIQRLLEVDTSRQLPDGLVENVVAQMDEMSKEELVERMVALEFQRLLKDYRSDSDLNAAADGKKVPKSRSVSKFARFHINIGQKNNLNPNRLIGFLNEQPALEGAPVGKIEIMKKFSFFDIDADLAEAVIPALDGLQWGSIQVAIERAEPRPETGGRGFRDFKGQGKKKFAGPKGKFTGKGGKKKFKKKAW